MARQSGRSREHFRAARAAEVAVISVLVGIRVDEVGVDQTPATFAEDRRRLAVEGLGCQQRELMDQLDEVGVGGVIVLGGCDDVVLHQLCNVGDRVGHDRDSFSSSVYGRGRVRR